MEQKRFKKWIADDPGRKALLLLACIMLLVTVPFGPRFSADSLTAAPVFSPAMKILSGEMSMTKSGILGHELCFSMDDFDTALGYECYSVTLLSLPDPSLGSLQLSEKPVEQGQVIPRGELNNLRFVPVCTVPSSAGFTYGAVGSGNQYEIDCRLYLLETLNFAPCAPSDSTEEDTAVETFSGISYFGSFGGEDPEGDELHFEITRYPRKGILFTDDEGGYRYAPVSGFTGKDSFSYVCVDRYGNRSEEIPVSVRVSGISSGVLYSDLREHPAGVAATVLAEKNIMTGKTVGGKYIFAPDESITREEFAAVLMEAMGVAPKKTDLSAFEKSEGTAETSAPYFTATGALGYLQETLGESGDSLKSDDPITVAEAAVLLTAVTGLEEDALATFAPGDLGSLPAWAAVPVTAMQSLGILETGDPDGTVSAPMTRGETAVSVCALLRYLEK